MCGIAGIFNLDGESVDESLLQRMSAALKHRGPDGNGVFVDRNLGIAHQRLAIIDLSDAAAQPMQSNSGRWTISFNGCIYNYKELREELRAKGYSFRSTSDAEVIAEGLNAEGVSFFERLNGMFAIAAWDAEERCLYLSRDRFGVKPLYYYFNGKKLLFASEVKAFMPHPAYQVELDHDALNEYFTFQNMFRFKTLFKGVILLPPANTVKIDSQSLKVKHHSWWDYDFSEVDEQMSFDEAVSETERLLAQSVERQMISDVPVGSYLSGGMDSGSITAIASRHLPRISTFTCGFDMSEVTGKEANYDERRDAELMANHYKTEHYEQVINAGDLSWSLPRVVWHLEDLRVGMSYPNYYISRLASKFVKVCLQGTGGDELYGGYPWRYYHVFQSVNQQEYFDSYYSFWQRLVPDKQKPQLFQDSVLNELQGAEDPRTVFERVFLFNDKLAYDTPEQHIQNSLYFEIKTFLHGLLLVGDKLSMANGLEERFPFLDNDLVNFAQKVPVKHKLGKLEEMKRVDENQTKKGRLRYREFDDGKSVLRRAMMDFIPKKIVERKKQGFSAPDESWYRGENLNYVQEILLNNKTISTEFIREDYIRNIVNEHLEHKANHRLLIWSFLNFEMWCRVFLDGQKVT
jgi:asparagine synthase (glutamine-hydrolysing)